MGRKTLCVCLALGLFAQPSLHAQAPADAAVAKGIKQVEDGDLDAAIFTLDAAARRLSGDPLRTREAAQAYLYLGVAYLGKGHEMAAKAKFKEAVQQLRDLSLSPDQFPPKVIDIFEAAKAEVTASAAAAKPAGTAPSPSPAPAPSATTAKKGGSKTPLILLGVGAAAAGGVALAAGGGGAGASRTTTPPTPNPSFVTIGPELLTVAQGYRGFFVFASTSGRFEAKLTWTPPWMPNSSAGPSAVLWLAFRDSEDTWVANGGLPSTPTTLEMSGQVTAGRYQIVIGHANESRSDATFTLQYKIP